MTRPILDVGPGFDLMVIERGGADIEQFDAVFDLVRR